MNKRIFFVFVVILSIIFPISGSIINLSAPEGTYYITDKKGKDYKLILKPKINRRSTSYQDVGKAELTRLGEEQETFYGSWKVNTRYNISPLELEYIEIDFSGETSDLVLVNYGCMNFVIGKDDWVYTDMFSCMDENPKYRVRVSKTPTVSKPQSSSPKQALEADDNTTLKEELRLSEFVTPIGYSDFGTKINCDFNSLQKLGFVEQENYGEFEAIKEPFSIGARIASNGEMVIMYGQKYNDKRELVSRILLAIPNNQEAEKLVQVLNNHPDWIQQNNNEAVIYRKRWSPIIVIQKHPIVIITDEDPSKLSSDNSDNKKLTNASAHDSTPLHGEMFVSHVEYDEYMSFWNVGVDAELLKSIGFSQTKKGSFFRDDVKIEEGGMTGDDEICSSDDEECVYRWINVTFKSMKDAKSFINTFKSMGWGEYDKDAFSSGGGDNGVSARLEGLTVIISNG